MANWYLFKRLLPFNNLIPFLWLHRGKTSFPKQIPLVLILLSTFLPSPITQSDMCPEPRLSKFNILSFEHFFCRIFRPSKLFQTFIYRQVCQTFIWAPVVPGPTFFTQGKIRSNWHPPKSWMFIETIIFSSQTRSVIWPLIFLFGRILQRQFCIFNCTWSLESPPVFYWQWLRHRTHSHMWWFRGLLQGWRKGGVISPLSKKWLVQCTRASNPFPFDAINPSQ